VNPMPVDPHVIHGYGAVESDAEPPELPAGIADTPVVTVTAGRIVALAGLLPTSDFAPSAWERHAEDEAWLADIAVGHHHVLQTAITTADVVPFRLPSLYGSLEALGRAMRDQADDIEQAMERVRGRVEWAVKLYRADQPDEPEAETDPVRTGSDYLIARSRAMQVRGEADDRLRDRIQDAYDQLSERSAASVRNRPQDSALSGRREPMVLNAAFLVDRTEQYRFCRSIDAIAGRFAEYGLLTEASGPWPAYNFASIAGAEPVAGPA
jgi:hypothetical protein